MESMSSSSNTNSDQKVCHSHCKTANSSVCQTLDEMDFERGIWNSALIGDIDDIERKIKSGSNVNKTDKAGYTALHYACRNGHFEVCLKLLSYNAKVNAVTQSGRATPLHRAAYMGHSKIISLMLEHKADPSLIDCDGMSPLHKAAENGHEEAVDVLLKAYPAAKNLEDNRGKKPVDLAKSEQLKAKLQP